MTKEDVLDYLKVICAKTGAITIYQYIAQYELGELNEENLKAAIEEWIVNFQEFDFLSEKGVTKKNEMVKLGNSYYSVKGIFGIGTADLENNQLDMIEYAIVLNPSNSENDRLLYNNLVIEKFRQRNVRDKYFQLYRDKLNILGVIAI